MENASEPSTNPISQGCGPNPQINIHVSPTTGGDFYLNIEADSTVENLKKMVSKRLKVPRDRICLLFRDKQLQDGNLVQYGISEGSRITLLPNVETGLINQRPEVGIMQALESLNDAQVSEFLCGKAPLNLSMRLGDHMMLIQLQLSTVSQQQAAAASTASSSTSNSAGTQAVPSTSRGVPTNPRPAPSPLVQTPAPPSLLQASKNLQHTLRRLSADIFAAGRDRNGVRGRRENVYSGTFSGALSPTLQDSRGRPRRDVATIVHILNDLLCSVPELRRSARGKEETPAPSAEDARSKELPSAASSSPGDDQTLVTRSKLDHLRLVMGERRERRRQRKQKPYSLPQSDSDTVTA